MKKATVIVAAYNQKEELKRCVKFLEQSEEEIHIILVDNGSADGVNDWIAETGYDSVVFDEGRQGYGSVLKAVLDNFMVEEYIFFLLPEYVVGKKTITNMIKTLESDKKIGMVGCRCNQFACEQSVEIEALEQLYQIEDTLQEERDYDVVGCAEGCLGIRREVLMDVGGFMQELVQSYNVMEDYQLRIIQKGYQNRLSRNACVYSDEKKAVDNMEKTLAFYDGKTQKKNWGMNYFNLQANTKFIPMIAKDEFMEFSLLEIGCDMGANLLGIHNAFPNSRIYGMELNEVAVKIGEKLANIVYGNIEDENVPFDEKFDYILFGDVLEHLRDPEKVLCYCKSLLKDGGCIVASVPNLMHVSVMRQLLNGRFCYEDTGLLDRTHIHLFTYRELMEMFRRAGYEVEEVRLSKLPLREEDEKLIAELMRISTGVEPFMYETYQYNIVAHK